MRQSVLVKHSACPIAEGSPITTPRTPRQDRSGPGLPPWRDLKAAAAALIERAPRWEAPFLRQIDPRPRDVLVDVGCGVGAFTTRLAAVAGGVFVIGVDANADSLNHARRAAAGLPTPPAFVAGRTEALPQLLAPWAPTKIVLRQALHTLAPSAQRQILFAAHDALAPDGEIHVADYGVQPSKLMQKRFAARAGDFPPTDLALRLRQAGFRGVEATGWYETADGAVTLLRGRAG